MAEKKERYTDAMLYNDLVQIVTVADLEEAKRNAIIEKLLKKQEQVAKRAEYSKEHRKPAAKKGPSEATKAIAAEIGAILTDTPMTTAEINDVLGTDYTALKVANATKFIPGVATTKVVRPMVNKAGLRMEKEYTAYFLA